MRWSRYYLYTTREVPRDAEVVSHQLMVRAGLIKKLAAGIYSYLPLGWRSLGKLMEIVRREMDAAGAIELLMPAIQPAELWQESGRWEAYGKELLRIRDRHERDFLFGPTHEEVITDIVRRDVKSYRQLPVALYQIQDKFRDEIRPRFGLMRGREFFMKDAYSFHTEEASLTATYEAMRDAYRRILEACGLDHTVVEADTGTIGGSLSHEVMVLAATGESAVVRCAACGYGANVEKAESRPVEEASAAAKQAAGGVEGSPAPLVAVPTPGVTTVPEVAALLGVEPRRVVKTLIYMTPSGPVAVAIRGDREVNEIKLAALLGVPEVRLAEAAEVTAATGAPVGFAGPVGRPDGLRLIADRTVAEMIDFVCGANRADTHYCGASWGRDARPGEVADVLLVSGGDPCPRCGSPLALSRGIEVGHVFVLGSKYSRPMGCVFLDEKGESHPMLMGCYGFGIGRTLAAAIEQNHDADGIIWPLPLAPFSVLVSALQPHDAEVARTAERLYEQLLAAGVEVLYDDRDERPGVKFKDADLIGVPVRVVVGAKSLAEGKVELSLRRTREKEMVAAADVVERVSRLLAEERSRR